MSVNGKNNYMCYNIGLCLVTISSDNSRNVMFIAYLTYYALYGILPISVIGSIDSRCVSALEDSDTMSCVCLRLNSTWCGVSAGF